MSGAAERRYERGEALWLTGDAVSACAVVLSGGRAGREPSALRRAEPHGGARPRRARRRCAHGDARQEKPRGRDRRAEYRGAFPAVPGDDGVVRARVRAHALLRENLLAEIAEKYWRLRRRAEYLARHSLRARIAAFLLDAAADAGGNTFSLGMRRRDLAAYLGANRSALCRELSRLRAEAGSTAAATVCGSSIPPRSQRAPRRRIGAEKNERNRKSERELSAALRRLTG